MVLVKKNKDTKILQIISAIPLSNREKEEIVEIIGKKTKKNFTANNQVDKNIIAGLYIRYKDKVIDMTFRRKIEALKERLSE